MHTAPYREGMSACLGRTAVNEESTGITRHPCVLGTGCKSQESTALHRASLSALISLPSSPSGMLIRQFICREDVW